MLSIDFSATRPAGLTPQRARLRGRDADFEGPPPGLGFGPGFRLDTDAFFDGL